MSGCVYGGDEVGALIIDPGHSSMRIGFAGEDFPRSEIPSMIGISSSLDENSVTSRKVHIGTNALNYPKSGMEVSTFMKNGMIDNWELFEEAMDFSFEKVLTTKSSLHPILMSEASLNETHRREKLTELMFEKYDVPAFFLAKSAVLAAFSLGRSTGLVLDSGASHTTVTPVLDGYILNKSVKKSSIGGNMLDQICHEYLVNRKIDLVTRFEVLSRAVVLDGQPPVWKRRTNLPEFTTSWHNYMINEVIQDFKATVLQVSEKPYDKQYSDSQAKIPYEFATGIREEFGGERFKIPETLFDSAHAKAPDAVSMSDLVVASAAACDIDLRPSLYSNVILTGGTTLIPGFYDRLSNDLANKLPPNLKFKIVSQTGTAERRFATWTGGSILSSLGSFQQMWISKQEYDEHGKTQIERKCP